MTLVHDPNRSSVEKSVVRYFFATFYFCKYSTQFYKNSNKYNIACLTLMTVTFSLCCGRFVEGYNNANCKLGTLFLLLLLSSSTLKRISCLEEDGQMSAVEKNRLLKRAMIFGDQIIN